MSTTRSTLLFLFLSSVIALAGSIAGLAATWEAAPRVRGTFAAALTLAVVGLTLSAAVAASRREKVLASRQLQHELYGLAERAQVANPAQREQIRVISGDMIDAAYSYIASMSDEGERLEAERLRGAVTAASAAMTVGYIPGGFHVPEGRRSSVGRGATPMTLEELEKLSDEELLALPEIVRLRERAEASRHGEEAADRQDDPRSQES